MDARRLLEWGDLDDRRRRSARRGIAALPPWVLCAGAAVLLAAEIARGMSLLGPAAAGGATPLSASREWLAVLIASHIVVLLGAPFRMYWRRDSALIGRMAIAGDVLFRVALVRSARAAVAVAVPCAAAAAMFALGPHGNAEIALRHLALVGVAVLSAGLLGPSVALAAGAVVASSKAQEIMASLGGELQGPRTAWLGALPGMAGAGLILLLIALTPWARGAATTPAGPPMLLLALGDLVPVIALLWASTRAATVMLPAVREVAALDQERLAHIDLVGPSPLERITAGLLGDRGAALVLCKDASLARRRYPIPFFLGVVGLITLWIVAIAVPDDLLTWSGVTCAGLGAYGVVMARRAMIPPIEHPVFLAGLPIARHAVARAKRARLVLWVLVYMLLGSVPVILRAPEPAVAASLLGAIMAATLVAGNRDPDPTGRCL